jgi:serpentine type 7TM GPCR chemoreceptor Srw
MHNNFLSIGNVLTLIVLNRRLMRKGGVNNLLQGLAISDIVAPTLACIPHIIYYYGPRSNGRLISFVNSYVMPVATGATFCSNWIGNFFFLFCSN